MKAKHRHDLKTNELAEWLVNLPQWAKKNRTMIIYVSVLIVVVAGLYIWKFYTKDVLQARRQRELTNLLTSLPRFKMQILQGQSQGFDTSFMLLRPANNLKTLADTMKDDQMAAVALIKRAQSLRTELHYRLEAARETEVSDQINLAKASYSEALSRLNSSGSGDSINPSLTAAAKFGLGLCEEELGNFDRARQIYRDLGENPILQCTTAAAAATQRLDTMSDYRKEVVFSKAPPAPQPQPQSVEPAGLDALDIGIGPDNTGLESPAPKLN